MKMQCPPNDFYPFQRSLPFLSASINDRYQSSSAQPRRHHGFTLIEVLVSLSILAIACIAVLQAALSIQSAYIDSSTKDRCAMLADLKLAQVKIIGPDQLIEQQGSFEDFPGYFFEVNLDPTSVETLSKVSVRVWAEDDVSESAGVQLQEYIYQEVD